tara:strand:+ start:94832 stop:95188 length:357 start_codon:yes stop_codon:yes gene_type:complete
MNIRSTVAAVSFGLFCQQASALSLAPEEFLASRQLACVLAEQSLGYLSEVEYGEKTHTVLDGFDDAERDNILAKALGYYDGLMFAVEDEQVNERLKTFVGSASCRDDGFRYVKHTVTL